MKHSRNKVLWSFWSQGHANAPVLVRECLASWRLHNPDWQLRVLDTRSAHDLVPEIAGLEQRDDISVQHYSDLLRVMLLGKYGGAWVDATLFCVQPLASWLTCDDGDSFWAFNSRRKDRIMTNWFLAAEPGSRMLALWTDELLNYWQHHRFPPQNGWRKAVTRKITSLRRRGKLSNDVWFSEFIATSLRLRPYPVNMYLFDRALDRCASSRALWMRRKPRYDDQPELLQNVYGQNAEVTKSSIEFMQSDRAPVHKLNWRQCENGFRAGSNLGHLRMIAYNRLEQLSETP